MVTAELPRLCRMLPGQTLQFTAVMVAGPPGDIDLDENLIDGVIG